MTPQFRPRLEEFFLALLWIIGTFAWGYFGLVGFIENLGNNGTAEFSLTGFILSYFLLCFTIFGIRFALNVLLRIWQHRPTWLDTLSTIMLGTTLLSGVVFSLFTLIISIIHLFTDKLSNVVFGWGVSASIVIFILTLIQLSVGLKTFQPFLSWPVESRQTHGILGWIQHQLQGRDFAPSRSGDTIQGPLLLENDDTSTLVEEKVNRRPGLEKTLVAHGGFHTTTLGFTGNGTTIFAVSDGGMVHYQAGGRKGVMFPPEVKFWEWETGRVQIARMGASQTFLTRHYQTPASLQNYRFLVPQSGGKFAWAAPQQLQVGNWNNTELLKLDIAQNESLVLHGYGGFLPLSFNPEGNRLAWCTADGQTRCWQLETNQVQPLRAYPTIENNVLTGSEKGTWGLLFSPEGSRLAILGGRGILLQNVYTGWRWFRSVDPALEKLTALAFNNNGLEMAVGVLARPEAIRTFSNGRRNRNGHSPRPTDGLTAPAEFTPVVRLWDLSEDRYYDIYAGVNALRELCYSPDNRLLAAVDEAGLLWLWDIAIEGNLQHAPRLALQLDLGLSGRKVVLNFTPDMQRLLCATDNRIMVWNLAHLRQETRV